MRPPVSTEVQREEVARLVDQVVALYDDGRAFESVTARGDAAGEPVEIVASTCENDCGVPFHVFVFVTRHASPNVLVQRGVEWDLDERRPKEDDE